MVAQRHRELTSKRRYELLRPIGKGGFGTVYLARLLGPGGFEKMVAVKILNQDADDHPGLASRLRDEARILGLVRNQTIVQVDGLLEVQGRWGVVMEYVDGLDLHGILRRASLPPRAALEIIGHLAMALDVAWNTPSPEGVPLHLIHRDIKPSNIKVTSAGEVKILDFGIARAEFEAREARTVLEGFGSPPYMAPERLTFRHDGPEGDIYSLGVVLFECLTRRMLYERRCFTREDLHVERVVVAQDVAWEATEQVSEELIHFMGDMLRFHPGERPRAEEVAQRCDVLVDELKGPRLRAWARASLPSISDIYGSVDGMSGVLLVEESGEVPSEVQDRGSGPTPVQVLRPPAPPKRVSSAPPAGGLDSGGGAMAAPTQMNPAAHAPPPAKDQNRRQSQTRKQDQPKQPPKAATAARRPARRGMHALLFAAVIVAAIAFGLFTTWTVRTITALLRESDGAATTAQHATTAAAVGTTTTAEAPGADATSTDPVGGAITPAAAVLAPHTPDSPAPSTSAPTSPTAQTPTTETPTTGTPTVQAPAPPTSQSAATSPAPSAGTPPKATSKGSSAGSSPQPTTRTGSRVSNTGASSEKPTTTSPAPAAAIPPSPPPDALSNKTELRLEGEGVRATVRVGGIDKDLPVLLEPGQYTITVVMSPTRKRDTVFFTAPSGGGTAVMTCNTRRCSIRIN